MSRKWMLFIGLSLSCIAGPALAQQDIRQEIFRARVEQLSEPRETNENGVMRTVQEVRLLLLDGPDEGGVQFLDNAFVSGTDRLRLEEGDTVLLELITKPNGTTEYIFRDQYRLPAILWLCVFFVGLAVLLGGMHGARSFLGLVLSILILVGIVVPQIAAGRNPLIVSLIGSFFIAFTSIYLAHGFHRRTTLALTSTMITLCLSVVLALFAVSFTKLFGTASEEALFLQFGPLATLNLRGLLLGGMIIGALGVLDDITTAQTASIAEISRANPRLNFHELYHAGKSIGREHIASLINTLALAYFGTSMPLMLLFSMNRDLPVWVILNSEFIAEEIVRTLVGSAALLLAVPISTWLAAYQYQRGAHRGEAGGHHHLH